MVTKVPAGGEGRAPETRIRARNEAKILRAAVGLFAAKGYDGTRFKDIAERSDLPKANVYYYFPTKERIYTALIEQVIDGWDQAFEHIVPEREPPDGVSASTAASIGTSAKRR